MLAAMNPSTPSLRARLVRAIVRLAVAPIVSGQGPAPQRRRTLERVSALSRLPPPRGTRRRPADFGGVAGEWIENQRIAPRRTVLYLHGGAYLMGSPATHRPLTSRLATHWAARVAVPDYRLAPEHPYPAAAEDVFTAYRHLLDQGVDPAGLVVAGDSAGGGLVLACLLQARAAGLPLPAAAVLFSPWVDLAVRSESARRIGRDAMLDQDRLRAAGAEYLAGAAPTTALASPLHADLSGLPRLLIQVTDTEILYDDARHLAERAARAGVASELRLHPGLWHVWQLFAGIVPEADRALAEAAVFLDRSTA